MNTGREGRSLAIRFGENLVRARSAAAPQAGDAWHGGVLTDGGWAG